MVLVLHASVPVSAPVSPSTELPLASVSETVAIGTSIGRIGVALLKPEHRVADGG
jgi:hypothetical protein